MDTTSLHPVRWHSPPWYESNPARLLLERQAMQTRFPEFRLVRDGKQLAWQGTLQSNRGNTYTIAIYYPDDFPASPPKVYPIEPSITVYKDAKYYMHQYNDGSLCLFYPGDRSFAPNTTAVTLIAWAAAWFFAYETWLASGRTEWPGRELA